MKKDTWMQFNRTLHAERRACNVNVTHIDFVNYGLGNVHQFRKLLEDWDDQTLIESTIRQLLERKYRDARHWVITHFVYSQSSMSIHVVVEHPSFAVVKVGDEAPMIDVRFEIPFSAATTRNATTAAGFLYSAKDMARNIERLEWFGYDVDPEWRRFCDFGPDDIGGPFEKLGIIRKRPSYDPGHGDSFSAMNIVRSDLLPPDQAYLIKVDLPLKPLYPSRGMCFFGDT